jgi:hypothetical protein
MHPNLRIALLTVGISVVTLADRLASAAEPDSVPATGLAQLQTVHRLRVGWLVAGAVTLSLSWGAAVVAAEGVLIVSGDGCDHACGSPAADRMFIPILGPLLAESAPDARTAFGFSPWIYGAWSVIQAAGAVMIVVGLLGDDVPKQQASSMRPALSIVPVVARGLSSFALNVTW